MDTRRVRVGCEFVHVAAIDTPTVFQVEPRDAAPVSLTQREWSTDPEVRIRHYTDLYGNPCARAMLPAGRSTLRFDALVLVPDATEDADEQAPELPPEELPDGVLIYTLPSRHLGQAGRVGRDPVTGPEFHPGVALTGHRLPTSASTAGCR
jgi:hypothetical protein